MTSRACMSARRYLKSWSDNLAENLYNAFTSYVKSNKGSIVSFKITCFTDKSCRRCMDIVGEVLRVMLENIGGIMHIRTRGEHKIPQFYFERRKLEEIDLEQFKQFVEKALERVQCRTACRYDSTTD